MGLPTQGPALTKTVQVVAAAQPPAIESMTVSQDKVWPGESVEVVAVASDPAGAPLTYEWSASTGSLSGQGDADPERVTWVAPETLGPATVILRVRNPTGAAATAQVSLWVVSAKPAGALGAELGGLYPAGLAVEGTGIVYVSDPRRHRVVGLSPWGDVVRSVEVQGNPTGLAVDAAGRLYVCDPARGAVAIYGLDGEPDLARPWVGDGPGAFREPTALTLDWDTGRVYVLDAGARLVRIFDEAGASLGAVRLGAVRPNSVTWTPEGLLVADDLAGRVLAVGVGVGQTGAAPFAAGMDDERLLGRAAGLTRGPGAVTYVADAFQGEVVALDAGGAVLESVGTYGADTGQMRIPLDVAVDPFGRLLVADAGNGRVDVFLTEQSAPVACDGDADCDGLADAWELAHGLDAKDPTDAFADTDGDGLVNRQEAAWSTDPTVADTDADGVLDGAEVAGGGVPTDPSDHRPVARLVRAEQQTDPARVVLDGGASWDPDGDTLTYTWEQLEGPAQVSLSDAHAQAPTVTLRAQGTYVWALTVRDGASTSAPVEALVTVRDVAPAADAGPDRGGVVGHAVVLDAGLSSDANGEPCAATWEQTAGPSVELGPAAAGGARRASGSVDGAAVRFVPPEAGVYAFQVTVTDPAGHASVDTVTVAVDEADAPLAAAVTRAPSVVAPGAVVRLDGRGSYGPVDAWRWEQVEGPAVTLLGADEPVATFRPTARGVYGFRLAVGEGTRWGTSAEVRVIVESPGDTLPRADAGPDREVETGQEIALDCGASTDADGDAVHCTWTQVAGPRATLRMDGEAITFEPLDPGTYRFELATHDAAGAGTRDELVIVVDAPTGEHVPRAAASASPAEVQVGGEVVLSGVDSEDADGDALGMLWVQTGGPRLPVADPTGPTLTLVPRQEGAYTFALWVDDGEARAPVASVSFQVGAAPAQGGVETSPVLPGGSGAPATPAAAPTAAGPQDGATVSGCAAGASPRGGASDLWVAWAVLLLLAVARALRGRLRRDVVGRSSRALGLVAVGALAWGWGAPARATDPPHDPSSLTNGCEDCHLPHTGAGMALNTVAGNANLCLSCHATRGMSWQSTDQAVIRTSGTSHRWDANPTNATADAVPPTDPGMVARLDPVTGSITCSTCHDQHSQAKTPGDPRAPAAAGTAGRHFMRLNNTSNELCIECHKARDVQSVKSGTWTGQALSHPVNVPFPGACPVGSTDGRCTTCEPGFSGTPCAADACTVAGQACGFGTCTADAACNTAVCGPGSHHDDLTGACVPNEACGPGSCSGVADACQLAPGGDVAYCACPVGYAGVDCSSCAGAPGFDPSTCLPLGCSSSGAACGYGTCTGPTAAVETQVCADNANEGAGQPCVSTSCDPADENANVAGRVGGDCARGGVTTRLPLDYQAVFQTQSPSGTSFHLWMRVVADLGLEAFQGEQYNCTLTGVNGGQTASFVFTDTGMQAGDYGPGCTSIAYTEAYCWALATGTSIVLDQGSHTLTCNAPVGNVSNEYVGYDGFLFTTDLTLVPQEGTPCGSDAAMTAGTCGANWGPNVYSAGGYTCSCDPGYTGPNCDQCDAAAGYVLVQGACVKPDPCATKSCANGGTCYVDATGTARCDCQGQWYGDTCTSCDVGGGLGCSCQAGYTGPLCDQCDESAGYFAWNGQCVNTDPCPTGDCGSPGWHQPPLDVGGGTQRGLVGTATGGTTTSLTEAGRTFGAVTGLLIRFKTGPNKGARRTIATSTGDTLTWSGPLGTAVAAGDRFEIDNDGNITNNVVLANGGGGSYASGKVVCLSCHGVHAADSDSGTYDDMESPPVGGDGRLLRRTNDETLCTACHDQLIHNSANTSTKHGTWGTNFTCLTCHDTHGTANIYLVRETIQTPNSGPKTVDFRTLNGGAEAYGLVNTANPGSGPCEVCHTLTENSDGSPRFRNDGSGDGGKHYTSRCTSCHGHPQAFAAGESKGGIECSGCHNDIWRRITGDLGTDSAGNAIVSRHTMGNVVGYNDSFDPAFPNATWSGPLDGTPVADRTCTNMCHNDHIHDKGGTFTTHENNVYTDATDQTTRVSAQTLDTDFDGTLPTGGLCTSCHDQPVTIAGAVHPAIDKAAYDASAHDFALGTYGLHDGSSFRRNCGKCHADSTDASPSDATIPFGAVHYSRFDSLLHGNARGNNAPAEFLCYECHGTGATKDLQTVVNHTANHPVEADTTHDSIAETSATWADGTYWGGNRHVACLDCHDTHMAGSTLHTQGTNTIGSGSPLRGASGLAWVQNGLGQWQAPDAGNFSPVGDAAHEYEICFKCHTSFAWGTANPGSTPSGGSRTDVAREFNPNNGHFHAVVGGSKARAGWGTYINGWSESSTMTCSDCHGSSQAGDVAGPHGSQEGHILKKRWDPTSTGKNGTQNDLCFDCHDWNTYSEQAQNGMNTAFSRSNGSRNLHRTHMRETFANTPYQSCAACHGVVPHGWPHSFPVYTKQDPAPYGTGMLLDENDLPSFGPAGFYTQNDCNGAHNTCN